MKNIDRDCMRRLTCHEDHDGDENDTTLAKEVVRHGGRHQPGGNLFGREGQVQRKSSEAQRGGQRVGDRKPQQAPQNITPARKLGEIWKEFLQVLLDIPGI